MGEHPGDLDLEFLRTGEADARTIEHVSSCVQCRERVDFFAALATNQRLDLGSIDVPQETENAILALAHRQAFRVRERSRRPRLIRLIGSAAAAAALALILLKLPQTDVKHPSTSPAELQEDVNRDGVVDILDALALAQRMEQLGGNARWDLNGDNRVDSGDVDWIARAAVQLDPGSS